MKSSSMTIRLSPILLAVFLAVQVSPLCASSNDVGGIDIVIKCKGDHPPCPGKAPLQARTDGNGLFSVHLAEGTASYQVTAVGGKTLTPGTSVKLSFSVQSAKPAPANSRKAASVSKTATAVLDASGGLAFPGDIQMSEASVLTGHLEIVQPLK